MNDPSTLEPTAPRGSVLISGVGASHGLGAAIARRFAAGGYPVAIAGRNAEKLAVTTDEIKATGAEVAYVVGNASKPADVARRTGIAACAKWKPPRACSRRCASVFAHFQERRWQVRASVVDRHGQGASSCAASTKFTGRDGRQNRALSGSQD
jgi:hypothetical protein